MKAFLKKLPKSQVELRIEIPVEEFETFIEKAILDLGKDLEVEGFRKGKAPEEIVFKGIGEEKIWQKTVGLTVEESYLKYITKEKIEPLSSPKIEVLYADKSPLKKPLLKILECQVNVKFH